MKPARIHPERHFLEESGDGAWTSSDIAKWSHPGSADNRPLKNHSPQPFLNATSILFNLVCNPDHIEQPDRLQLPLEQHSSDRSDEAQSKQDPRCQGVRLSC